MARFRFNLEGVLKRRKHIEQEQQRRMADLLRQMESLRDQVKEIEQSINGNTEDLRTSRLTGKLDLSYLAAHRRFVAGMRAKAMALVQKMARLQGQIEQARAELAQAAVQYKIMEKLKEKQFARWQEQISQKELAALDEVAMQMSYVRIAQGRDEELRLADAGQQAQRIES